MNEDEIKEFIMNYFSDTSRSPSETRVGLQDIVDHCKMLMESLPRD